MDDTHEPIEASTEILKRKISFKEVSRLYKSSDWEGLKQLVFHVSCLMLSAMLVYISIYRMNSLIFGGLAILLHGYLISFLFMPLHEAVHQTAFNSILVNKVISRIIGFLILRPAFAYKVYHFAHHKTIQVILNWIQNYKTVGLIL